jgi:hypothetical protein
MFAITALGGLAMLITQRWPGVIIFGIPAILAGRLLYGQIRIGVTADESGLVLRQLWRVRRIPWADIDRICPASEDWQKYVGVVLKDGRRVRCGALGAGRIENSARLDPYAAELNRWLAAARRRSPS